MHLIYIDDSHDQTAGLYVFSAIAIQADLWSDVFVSVRDWRRSIRDSDGIYVTKELHAWEFVSGRRRIAPPPRTVTKWRRCEIFKDGLRMLAEQDGVNIFNSALTNQDWAFERLLNRINRTMKAWQSHALLICDEGKEAHLTRLVRRMSVHNPIPSRYGVWLDTGRFTRNIPLDRIIEDPFFRPSVRSYFVQMADFCAYALLRKECPLPSKNKYGLHKAFTLLAPICVRAANPRDPHGIIR